MNNYNEICSSSSLATILGTLKAIINLIQLLSPFLILIGLTLVFVILKNNLDHKKIRKAIKSGCIAVVCLFVIPFLVNFVMNAAYEESEFARCYSSSDNYDFSSSNKVEVKEDSEKEDFDKTEVEKEKNSVTTFNNNSFNINNFDPNGFGFENTLGSSDINSDLIESDCTGGFCSVAHRGYSDKYIDNTADSYKAAGEANFWGCETDLRMSESGKIVCSHDDDGNLETKITFEEYLDICKKYNMIAIVDIKYDKEKEEDMLKKAIKMVKEKGMISNTIFQSSVVSTLNCVKKLDNNARIWYLAYSYDPKLINICKSSECEAINIDYLHVNKEQIEEFHNENIKVCVYVVPNSEYRDKFIEYNIDYIMSNLPLVEK